MGLATIKFTLETKRLGDQKETEEEFMGEGSSNESEDERQEECEEECEEE